MRKIAVFGTIILLLSFCVCLVSCSSPSAVISFSVNGEIVHSQTVSETSGLVDFSPPLDDGFSFGGWFLDEACSSPFDFHLYVSQGSFEDITVYALIIPPSEEIPPDEDESSEDKDDCEHELVFVQAKEPTCTQQGNCAYWQCSLCNNIFSDETCSSPSHPFTSPLGHSASFVSAKAASCTEDGHVEHWLCSQCKKAFADEACSVELSNSVISKYGHSPVRSPARDSTCSVQGVKEHWVCSSCGALLAHPDDTVSVSLSELRSPLLPHDFSSFSISSPPSKTDAGSLLLSCACGATCVYPVPALSENDYFVDVELETCSKYGFESYTLKDFDYPAHIVLTLPRHSPSLSEPHGARPATCSEEGFTGTIVCTECGETVSNGEVIPKLDHDYVITDSLPSSCTCQGYITYACSQCGDHYTKSLPLAEHGFTLVSETPSSCVSTGIAEHYVCSGCGEIFDMQKQPCSFQDIVLPIAEHDFTLIPEKSSSCVSTGEAEHYICSGCGEVFDMQKQPCSFQDIVLPIAEHDFTLIPEKSSSCVSTGEAEHYICSGCGELFDIQKQPCTLQDLVLPLVEHSFADSGICSVCGTANIPGAIYTLSDSGYTFGFDQGTAFSSDSLIVPSSYNGLPITHIDDSALRVCAEVHSLSLPDSLLSLPNLSPLQNIRRLSVPFLGSSRNDPSSLKDMFDGRIPSSLTCVIVTNSTSIPDDAFATANNVAEIHINEGCTYIGENAFLSCIRLATLYLPSTLQNISPSAFDKRQSFVLATDPHIYFSGTETQWNALAANFTLPDNVEVCFETKT